MRQDPLTPNISQKTYTKSQLLIYLILRLLIS